MSAIATSGAITLHNRDVDKNEGKNVQNEGVSLLLVDRTDSNGYCQDWKILPTTLSLWISRRAMLEKIVQLWTTPQAIIQVQLGINQYLNI